MSTEGTSRPSIKVTDKRLFTEEGDLRDPASLKEESASEPPAGESSGASREATTSAEAQPPTQGVIDTEAPPEGGDPLENPGTLFAGFLDSLVVNAYMALGMVRNPYRTEPEVDIQGARQMIDIIEMLGEKTKGNLTPTEERYLNAHLGELKLAFVRRSQSVG